MIYIFVLSLENNKFFVGKTTTPNQTTQAFLNCSYQNNWTSKYKPLSIVEIIEGDNFDEDKYTIKYMSKYGIENVRGGTFKNNVLNATEMYVINQMIMNAFDCCTKCMKKGHFSKDCEPEWIAIEEEAISLIDKLWENIREIKKIIDQTTNTLVI